MRNLPPHLKRHQPHFEYHLLDIAQCVLGDELSDNNLIAPLIEFEQSVQRREQVLPIIKKMGQKLASSEFDSYRRTMYIYMCRMIGLGKIEEIDLTDLEGGAMLVQERMKIYDKSLVEQGRQEGRQEGREQATLELALNMLASGLDIIQVMKITGLTAETLRQKKPH